MDTLSSHKAPNLEKVDGSNEIKELTISNLPIPDKQCDTHCRERKMDAESLASNVALLLEINPEKSTNVVNKSIEVDLLTRLDELHGMLDMIKSDNFILVNEFLPNMHAKMKELRPIFEQIDRLEVFVNTIRQNVIAIENDLNNADVYSSFKMLKKAFSGMSLFGNKKESSQAVYNPPAIFRTSDFFELQNQNNELV